MQIYRKDEMENPICLKNEFNAKRKRMNCTWKFISIENVSVELNVVELCVVVVVVIAVTFFCYLARQMSKLLWCKWKKEAESPLKNKTGEKNPSETKE